MKSSELARMAGVSVRTLRHYHAIGLLPEPPRGDNGYRDYEPTHLLRLLRIRQLASLGFSLEQIDPMLQDLDAERAEGDERRGESDRLLDDLDRQLQEQITQLERQRELIVRIRSGQGEPDYPARAARALEAIEDFERTSHGQGFLLCALTGNDKTAMGVAAHLYSVDELAEIERIFHAIPERGLTQEYLHVSRLMQEQITQLERQRELIVRIRSGQGEPDYPARAARALEAIEDFERTSHGQGFLLCALTGNDKTAMGVAAHLYSVDELAEIERIFHAIPERGLTQEYLHVSRLMDTLPAHASTERREAAIEAGLSFLEKIDDCFDVRNWLRPDKDYELVLENTLPAHASTERREAAIEAGLSFLEKIDDCFDVRNWLRPDKDYELVLENMASAHYNDAQIAASDELFMRFTRRMAERAEHGGRTSSTEA